MLESACKNGGAASDADAIAALEYDMDASALMAWLVVVTSNPAPSNAIGSVGHANSLVGPQCSVGTSGSGAVNVIFHSEPAETSEQDREEHGQLRDDAESVSKEPRTMALIASMKVVKASGDAEALGKLTSQIKDARLLRLLNTTVDLRTAMQGGFTEIYTALYTASSQLPLHSPLPHPPHNPTSPSSPPQPSPLPYF